MKPGSYTALITPFMDSLIDMEGIRKLIDFQIQNGIAGIVVAGTTGEKPTLAKDEHSKLVKIAGEMIDKQIVFIVGVGGNNTLEAIEAARHADFSGADAVLLVDPYYNAPSSMEIRKEYIIPVATKMPNLDVIPYVIPSRTGTQLLPEDIAILYKKYDNVCAIKDATGDIENARKIRVCCGKKFTIFSGDDLMLFKMMSDPIIIADGIISAISNVIPRTIHKLTSMLYSGELGKAKELVSVIEPLFKVVTVDTIEQTPYSSVLCRARNPLPLKTLMNILGMPSGRCRPPLGKMSKLGFQVVLKAARSVNMTNPEVFQPISDFFNVNVEERLLDAECMENLFYRSY